jgi:methionine sulfoxide reductase heme-binding subunit
MAGARYGQRMNAPSPLWYTTRSAGFVLLVLLTASLILGILINGRWSLAGVPRFVPNHLHRNLSLLAVVFLVLHILTSIIDSFAHLGLKDALIPFASSYRPIWLGLGVLGAELFMAVVITSLVRGAMGYGVWQVIHWTAYLSWPMAVLHGLGTGSDTKAWWALAINAVCVGAVFLALAWRIAALSPRSTWRVGVFAASIVGSVALLVWLVQGPLHPGWALASGTPRDLLARVGALPAASSTAAAYTLPKGLNDQLQGQVQQAGSGGARVLLTDVRDPSLHLVITIADAQATAVTVAVSHGSRSICSVPASVAQGVSAICGGTHLAVESLIQQADGTVVGQLVTQSA